MSLPQIAVPNFLPFDVPTMLHPVVVHFAVALPIVVLLLELANLMFRRRAVSVASLSLLLLAVVVYFAAYFTGKADGGEAFDLLGAEAREALGGHRLLGAYLVYALLIPLLFKLMAMLMAQKWARGALIVSLVIFISFVVKQGYDGGELVYRYGVNVSEVTAAQEAATESLETLEEMNATVAEQAAEIETLKAEIAAMKREADRSLGNRVDKAVTEAVSTVKKIFSEGNATAAPAPKETVPDANGTI